MDAVVQNDDHGSRLRVYREGRPGEAEQAIGTWRGERADVIAVVQPPAERKTLEPEARSANGSGKIVLDARADQVAPNEGLPADRALVQPQATEPEQVRSGRE